MITSISDKQSKMRQYMFMQGLGSFTYYSGQFIADIALFCITSAIFLIFVWVLGLKAITTQMGGFFALMTSFGAVIIPLTYFAMHFFRDANSAFKYVGTIYLVFGLICPQAL